MKLFLDENLSPQHAAELRTEGHDAVAVLEVGLSGATDEQVLRFAVENGRVLITLDADFANVMRFPPEQTLGVIRLKVHPATEERTYQHASHHPFPESLVTPTGFILEGLPCEKGLRENRKETSPQHKARTT